MQLTKRQFLGTLSAATLAAVAPRFANAQQRNVLVLASNTDIQSFDPHVATGYAPYWMFRNVYDPLVRVRNTPPELVPNLALSWTMSEDGKVYEFELDPAAKFADGKPVTAADVAYSFQRIIRLSRGSAWMINGVLTEEGVKAEGDYKVIFNLQQSFAPFLQVLPWMFVVNSAVVESNKGEDDGETFLMSNAAGSGPFQIGRTSPGDLYELTRVADSWHKDLGNLDAAIWKIVRESSTARLMLEQQEVHFALELYAEDIDTLASKPGIVPIVEADYRSFSIKMNTVKGPLADKNLRKAISYAYNYQGMLDAAGPAELMVGPLPTGMFGHAPDLTTYRTDMDKAKEYLAKSEYKDGGFTLSIVHAAGYENQRRWCLLLLESLRGLNIDLEIKPAVWPDMVSMVASPETTPDFFCIFQGPYYADPDNTAFAAYSSTRNGQWQNPVYSNPEVDRLIDAGRAEIDAEKRATIYRKLQELLVEDAPDIFGVLEKRKYAHRDFVKGYAFCPVGSNSVEMHAISIG